MVMRIQSCEVLWDTELITCEGVQVVWNGSERSNCVVTSSVCVCAICDGVIFGDELDHGKVCM